MVKMGSLEGEGMDLGVEESPLMVEVVESVHVGGSKGYEEQ